MHGVDVNLSANGTDEPKKNSHAIIPTDSEEMKLREAL